MNEQKAPNGIEWTRRPLPDGTRSRGYTWNVVGGCKHACQWQMPDGAVAECYAKTVAERVAQVAYPQGFEAHYWHPERLSEPIKLKEPAGIFIDSMADLMGHWVEDVQIKQVLDVCQRANQHVFFLLTKNAPRLKLFEYPDNVWAGASSPPDWMFGKRLTRQQQEKMLHRTLEVLSETKAKVRWISFEPLSWDCSKIVAQYPKALQWAVIGGASNGAKEYPPALDDLLSLLDVLDAQRVPVFYKGNMHTLPYASAHWRDGFPGYMQAEHFYAGYTDTDSDFPDEWGSAPRQAFIKVTATPQPPPLTPAPEASKEQVAKAGQNLTDICQTTRVVNFQDVKAHWDKAAQQWDDPQYVYIGRANAAYNLRRSLWANDYHIVKDTDEARHRAISAYRSFIQRSIADQPFMREKFEALRGKTLVCWCSPKACHGDVLLELLGEKPAETPNTPEPEAQPKQFSLFDDATMKAAHRSPVHY